MVVEKNGRLTERFFHNQLYQQILLLLSLLNAENYELSIIFFWNHKYLKTTIFAIIFEMFDFIIHKRIEQVLACISGLSRLYQTLGKYWNCE